MHEARLKTAGPIVLLSRNNAIVRNVPFTTWARERVSELIGKKNRNYFSEVGIPRSIRKLGKKGAKVISVFD